MTDTITISCAAGATTTVTAHPTATPGLIVHTQGLVGDTWRLTHQQSTHTLGEFDDFREAQDAASALAGVTDWTAGSKALQDERVIWRAIEAIEYAGGRFLCRRGGLGEQVAAKRQAALAGGGE
ncbi:hypothetical protein [Streptomyces sp. NPDC055105]|uniref:hypothetical protein n=1 Tax=Streptomyces sp. NPDC055105 TaxID=3365719 RepID=UPI0037D749BB